MNRLKNIPEFKTEEEERAFWEVNDSSDYVEWEKATAQRVHRTLDAPDVVVDAVARAKMDPEHDSLDELLD